MSRVGKLPVAIPSGTDVKIENNIITVKGKLGELVSNVNNNVTLECKDGNISTFPKDKTNHSLAMWGTTRSLIQNMVQGVTEGFSITLEISGVGYKSDVKGNILTLYLGYSHEIKVAIPSDIKIICEKPTIIVISGISKQKVGSVASKIIRYRPVEPYKGKGIKKKGSFVRRKEGKKK